MNYADCISLNSDVFKLMILICNGVVTYTGLVYLFVLLLQIYARYGGKASIAESVCVLQFSVVYSPRGA